MENGSVNGSEIQSDTCACRKRNWSILHRKMSFVFVSTVIALTLLTFLCEQDVLRGVCAGYSGTGGLDDGIGSRVRLKTTDAGIFIGIKKRVEVLPNLDELDQEPALRHARPGNQEQRQVNEVTNDFGREVNSSGGKIYDYTTGKNFRNDTGGNGEGGGGKYKVYYVFKGIPYAQPPEGKLRWKDPLPVDIKSSAQDNTKYKPVCTQWNPREKRVVGSQDCLYLNIFTPHIPPPLRRPFLPNPYTVQDIFYQERHLYPVLIYIHSGDLISGSGNWFGGSKLLQSQDVVLVTLNYRLGIFGYLSSGDENIPGNFGLLDQIAAIKWVNKYIQRFGGNPTRITIFGDVGYLLLSPLAVGLFNGAIWQTGGNQILNPPNNSSVLQKPGDLITRVCLRSGCCEEGSDWEDKQEDMLDCLGVTPAAQLMKIQAELLKFGSYPKTFLPVVDVGWRDFPVMMSDPEDLLEMGTLVKVPLILGTNHLEGYELLRDFVQECGGIERVRKLGAVKECLRERVRWMLWEDDGLGVQEAVFNEIWEHYFLDEGVDETTSRSVILERLLALFGDMKGHVGFSKLMNKLTRNSKPPAFAYVFGGGGQGDGFLRYFENDWNASNGYIGGNGIPPWQDLHYLLTPVKEEDGEEIDENRIDASFDFPGAVTSSQLTRSPSGSESETLLLADSYKKLKAQQEEQDANGMMEGIMAKIWTSFANYGTPKQAVSGFENWTRWYRIERKKIRYYDLQLQPGSMKTGFRAESLVFWEEILPGVRAEALENDSKSVEFSILFWAIFLGLFLILLCVSSFLIYCCCFR